MLPAFVDEEAGNPFPLRLSLDQLLMILGFCVAWLVASQLTILLHGGKHWIADLVWVWMPLLGVGLAWRVHGQPLYRRLSSR